MAKKSERREKGTGTVFQRENGTWSGRINEGIGSNGKPKYKYFSGKTEAEIKRKIREYIKSGSKVDVKKISVGTYVIDWLQTFKKNTIKDTSYDTLEKTVRNYIVPKLGGIQLQQLTSNDIQTCLQEMKDAGYSYSTVKKVHVCLNEVLLHATVKKDIAENPMLLVKMLSKESFESKEIRFFNNRECALIMEEAMREYSTGRRIYLYGDAFILILNTGLRIGELLGLEKGDWDREAKTLRIKRNLQSVRNRDSEGNLLKGSRLVTNSTKTYSGDRILPLNKNATEALERLCAANPESKLIVCSSKGTVVPRERIERTFHYLLKNIGIETTGPHSLRHTFASMLFAEKKDIKTISKLMGHANIQITLNTYIHLFEDVDHDAVAALDDVI